MSTKRKKAKPKKPDFTEEDAARAVVWFKERIGLQDWTIALFIQDGPPEWVGEPDEDQMGETDTDKRYKSAKIWASPKASEARGEDILVTLFHEMFHAVAADTNIEEDTEEEKEFLWTKLAEVAVGLYKRERR